MNRSNTGVVSQPVRYFHIFMAAAMMGMLPVIGQAEEQAEILSATASHTSGGTSYSINNTIDGSITNSKTWKAWQSPVTVEYELQNTVDVSSVKIAWYKATSRSCQFDILVSEDASSWQAVLSGERSNGDNLAAVAGNTLELKTPLYYTYNANMNPQLTRIRMLTGAGLEDLYMRKTDGSGASRSIDFYKSAHCWVKGVWSEKADKAHIQFYRAYGNEVRNSYFHSAHDHGAGGHGYGIRYEKYASNNLVIDNVFNHLRHSMVPVLGANGNVHAYNYSLNPYTSQSPNWLTSDITIHGGYPYMNLFEGNVVQHIVSDDIHGTNGPTTFFRNRVEKNSKTIEASISSPAKFGFIELHQNNRYHNVIGNDLGMVDSFETTEEIEVDSAEVDRNYELYLRLSLIY